MKKLVLPVLTLIIGFVIGYYFAQSKSTGVAALSVGHTQVSENSISREEAQMLVDTFGRYGMEDANHKPGGKGLRTRSSFIPLKELDNLVATLDSARAKDGKTDGIRIYFGRYPKLHPDGKTPYEHPYRNTIIMVSTRDTSVIRKGGNQPTRIHIDYFGAPNKKLPMNMFFIDPQNRTEQCPDNCDGSTLVCPDPTDPSCTGCTIGGSH